MELLVEVVHGTDRSTDVVLEVEPGATFGDVADALGFLGRVRRHAGHRPHRPDPRRDDRVADVDVRSGDRLTLVDAVNAAFSSTPEAFGASLVVTSPSGAEVEHPLRYGDNLLGRDSDVDVVVKDQQVSRRHARITVTDVVTITDLGSKNGVVINGTAITTPTLLRPGQTAEIGDLTLAIRDHVRAVEALASRNRVEFNRPPRVARPYGGVEVELPAPPDRPRRQRLPMISALLPVLLGIVMYFLIGPIGAIFMLLSPVLLIGSVIEARRTGQHEFKEALADHAHDGRRTGASTSRRSASRRCAAGSVSCPAAASSAASCAASRTGCGSGPPTTPTSSSCGWARPQLPVAHDGARWPAAVPATCVGSSTRSPAASAPSTTCRCRSTCSSRAASGWPARWRRRGRWPGRWSCRPSTMHSPTDLAVVALVGEAGLDDWTFLKWLPHARSLGGSQLASTSHHALGLVNGLLQARSGGGGGA